MFPEHVNEVVKFLVALLGAIALTVFALAEDVSEWLYVVVGYITAAAVWLAPNREQRTSARR